MQGNADEHINREDSFTPDWMNPLFTDMYQIKMAYAAWKAKRQDEIAVFEMFFRKCPFKGKYALFNGHDEVLKFLSTFKFQDAHLQYLKQVISQAEPEFFEWLRNLDCSQISVYGMGSGEIVFGNEPLLRLEGPFALLQLIESPLLNFTNFSSLVSTNASRMIMVAAPSKCVEFGLRRAQGPTAAMLASKYSYLGGFAGTSNVYAGYLMGVPALGTMAHSFIMSFEKEADIDHCRKIGDVDLLPLCLKYRDELGWTETNLGELYAFIAFATSYPDSSSFLVDSYSTMNSGVKNYAILALVLKDLGHDAKGIRLDSGDLAQLSKDCKAIIHETGAKYNYDFTKHNVVASNDINEQSLIELNQSNHQIDVFGIGTNLVTCQAQPALGMVYKVVFFQGTARMKFSEEIEKITLPGAKQVFRIYVNGSERPEFDLLCLDDETEQLKNAKELKYFKTKSLDCEASQIENITKAEPLLHKLFEKNESQVNLAHLDARREETSKKLKSFGGKEGLIDSPDIKYQVYYSEGLYNLFVTKYKELFV